jgi:ATP-dependent helicase/DNAse subunit B
VARDGAHSTILSQVLARTEAALLLRGPAGAGKTSVVLDLYEHYEQAGAGQCVLLAPNAPAAAALRRRLMQRAVGGVLVAPAVMTFASLAARILSGAAQPARRLTPVARHLLLRRIVEQLGAQGKLSAIGAVLDTPGLPAALDKSIAELKRAAIEPEALAAAIGNSRGKTRDLLEVYRRYQEHLREEHAFDTEGLLWLVRDILAGLPAGAAVPGLPALAAVAADGFTDFTPTQLDILASLAARVQRVVITLPLDDDGRGRLWHWTARTAAQIRGKFAGKCAEIALARAPGEAAPHAPLWDRLFDFDAQPCPLPRGISIIAACGIEGEVAAVARRVKRCLLAGAEPGSIAVLARSLEAYRPAIERIFRRCEIPLAQGPQGLLAVPIVALAFEAAELAGEGFDHCRVLRVIKNSYFRPGALGPYDASTVAAAETIIRQGNVVRGRESYSRAAGRLAAIAGRTSDLDDDTPSPAQLPTPQACADADAMLQALFSLSAPGEAAVGASAESAGARLAAVIEGLQLHAAACGQDEPSLIGRDLRALAALAAALWELPEPQPGVAHLKAAMAEATCPGAGGESLVDVLDVLDARALRYRHVFCLGVGEGQFPRRPGDSALISEGDRAAWAHRGLALDQRGDLTAREMLLFYLAASRTDETLTLSFLEFDAAGKASAASSFLHSLLGPCGGYDAVAKAGRVERIGPGQFLPEPDEIAGSQEAVSAAVAGLFAGPRDAYRSALSWAAASCPEKIERAAAGIFARHCRWNAGPCDRFDGLVTEPALTASLGATFGPEAVFSPSQINTFGRCPWQFFARYVLSLHQPPEVEDRPSSSDRGLFCHRVLCQVMLSLGGPGGASVQLAKVGEGRLRDALDAAVAGESARIEAIGLAYPALWKVQRLQMHRQLWAYLQAQRQSAGELGATSLHFELSFGAGSAARGTVDPASVAEPVAIATSAGSVRFRGRIDRVDRIARPDAAGLLVVDYKTGSLPTAADVEAGRNVQLPVYAAAAQAILGEPSRGGAFHGVLGSAGPTERYFAAITTRGGEFVPWPKYAEKLQAAMDRIGQAIGAIRAGRFDLQPSQCPSYCAYRQICHYARFRAELKCPPPQEAVT